MVAGVQQYWREEFPGRFGRSWTDIRGFLAADPADYANPPPCLQRSLDLTDQALYCPGMDTVAWDRTRLVPKLRRDYGDSAVIAALSHEIGHAVQDRIGIDTMAQLREPRRYPTILLEGMADCFAGATLRAVSRDRVPGLSTSPAEVDGALRALVSFRDPADTEPGHAAHGNAFDRASAFIGGYQLGAEECAAMSVDETAFTQRWYVSGAQGQVAAPRGPAPPPARLPGPTLLDSVQADAREWFGRLSATRDQRWPTRELLSGVRCARSARGGPGLAGFCPGDFTAAVSHDQLDTVHRQFGDYASATVVLSRYALAALAAMNRPVVGSEAGRTAVCLTGAYTRGLLTRDDGFSLSPGDLDEAVDTLLTDDLAARDGNGRAAPEDSGLDRVRQFRAGVLGGPGACGI